MAESLDQINMGDMLKLGAMKLLGPSKADIQEEEQKDANKSIAFDKLHGDDMMGGLTGIMQDIGEDNFNSSGIFRNREAIQAAGIDVDVEKIGKNASAGEIGAEQGRILKLLQQQIDMYKMQEQTGIVAPTGTSNAFASTPMPSIAGPILPGTVTGSATTEPQATPTTPKSNALESDMAGMSNTELMEKLVSLQTENNRLLAKNVGATKDLNT
jgi:hypothetical protein